MINIQVSEKYFNKKSSLFPYYSGLRNYNHAKVAVTMSSSSYTRHIHAIFAQYAHIYILFTPYILHMYHKYVIYISY